MMGPFSTKAEIKNAVELVSNGVFALKPIVSKSDDMEPTPMSDPNIASRIDTLNLSVHTARKQGVKDLLIMFAEVYRELGRAVNMGAPDPQPVDLGVCALYPMPFTHKDNVNNAIDVQAYDSKVVLTQLVDAIPEAAMSPQGTTTTDPRIQNVFTYLFTDDQQDYKASFMKAAFVYGDNLVALSGAWT